MEDDEMVEVTLIPVEVFGDGTDEWSYGLCDAVSPWSDCNRAVNHIFRAEDSPHVDQASGEAEYQARSVVVWVRRGDLHRLGWSVVEG